MLLVSRAGKFIDCGLNAWEPPEGLVEHHDTGGAFRAEGSPGLRTRDRQSHPIETTAGSRQFSAVLADA